MDGLPSRFNPVSLAVLRAWFGDQYEINWHFQTRTYRAVCRVNGYVLEDQDADELWLLVRAHSLNLTP